MAYFNPATWKTEATYGNTFDVPHGPGIYLIAFRTIILLPKRAVRYKILYVGMSRNLETRVPGHEIISEAKKALRLKPKLTDIVVFFRNHSKNLREIEKHYIKHFNPPFNIQHRKRGL